MGTRSRVEQHLEGGHKPRQAALVALYETNVDDLYRFCLARTGSTVTAEEVTSEAFVAAARAFAGGRGSEIDRPWLFVVAKRRIVDQWRAEERNRRRVEKARKAIDQTINLEADGPGVFDHTSEAVVEALQSLPSRQRAALALRYLDECSVAEVATALGVEYRAAESLLARGRRGFSRAWQETSRRQEERA